MSDYHTALRPDEENRPSVYRWERPGVGMAFVHDVNLGLPLIMSRCDFIYSEIPWKDGYMEFLDRAGAIQGRMMPYEKWLFRLGISLVRFGKPYVIVAGHAASRHLPCEWMQPVNLNGSTAMAIGGYLDRIADAHDAESLLRRLVVRSVSSGSQWVADPCAGFGRTARIARQHGCQFVCTDINPRCIGTIAEEFA